MHSFFISVQQLQTLEDFVDVSNFSYSIFVNSLSLGTFKLNQPHFIPITSTSTDDHIQILFYTNDHQELYGCISFITKQLIEPKQENILQWATLFDDPEDDLFDGKIGEEDEELPRAFLQVSVKQEQTILQIEDESQINFEAGIRERGQEINLQQTLELSSVACPRYDGPFPKSCDISVMSTHHHKILESPEKSFSCMTTVSIEPMQIPLLDTKCPFILERRSSLESVNHTEASLEDQIGLNSENEANKIQQAGTRTTTGSVNIIDNKNDSKNSLSHLNESNAKDLAETIFSVKQKECPETLNNLKDNTPSFTRIANPSVEEENTILHSKVRELEEVIERLQRENALRSQNEGVYAAKINSLKVEIESIRIEKESCEKKLADMEGLLKAETAVKPQIEAQSKVQPTEGIKNPIIVSSQEITALKSQIQFDETIIQKLHEEIFNLRQKEDENVDLNNKLIVAHQKIRNYQEKFSALAQLFSLFDDEISDFEITEESTCRIYEQLVEKAKETCELKNLNEDLTIRLSICDNKLLADSLLGQIESLKGNINSLEKERETLKEELTKTNQNYMNLTTKYMELSDIFASMKKPSQNEQPTSASASKLSTPNLKRSTKQKSLQKNESVDDIEAKLIETSVLHKVPPSLLSRIEYGVYLYMGKKIHLKIQDGQLVVKAGETYKPFQEFVKIKSGNNSASTCNMTKSNPQNLKLLLKDINKEEKSVDQKLRARVSNYHSVQVEQSQRDMSSDFETTSRSICKENARSLSKQTSQTSSLVMEIKNSNLKALTRIDRDRQLKEILSSRMIDRKLSQTMYGRKDKSQRDLTPL